MAKTTKNKKTSIKKPTYMKGIIGSFIGGMIASIPWIWIYVYGQEIYTIFALIIATGALIGYQLFKAKVDKKLPFIIAGISQLCVTIATLIIIPLLLLTQYGGSLSLLNLKILYGDPTFVRPLMKDYIVSILYTIVGMSLPISHIYNFIKRNPNQENLEIPIGSGSKKDKDAVKKYFILKDALTEEKAIEIEENANIKIYSLEALIDDGIIIKTGDKYYYSEKNNDRVTTSNKQANKLVSIVLFVLMGLALLISIFPSEESIQESPNYRVPKDITFELPNTYLEQVDPSEVNSWAYIPNEDISGGSGLIYVSYTNERIELTKENLAILKSSFYRTTGVKKVTQGKVFTTSNNYKAIEYKVEFKEYTDYIYYIVSDKYTGIIDIIDYNKIDNLLEDGKKVVDTLNWIE